MAMRNPWQKAKETYLNRIHEKTFTPKIFWQRCECCGKEYRHIPIFRITKSSLHFEYDYTYNGCSNCFHNMKEFRKYLEEKRHLLTAEDFDWAEEFKTRLVENDPTITKEEKERFLGIMLE